MLLFENNERTWIVLCGANQADRPTAAAVVAVRGIEIARTEVQIVRVVAIVVRSRPIATVGTDTVDRSPIAVAGSRKEDTTYVFHFSPVSCTNNIGCICRTCCIHIG